jgi:hypothetical protein
VAGVRDNVIDDPLSIQEFPLDELGRHLTKFRRQVRRQLMGLSTANLQYFANQRPCSYPPPSTSQFLIQSGNAVEPDDRKSKDQKITLPLLPFVPPSELAPPQLPGIVPPEIAPMQAGSLM